MRCFVERRFRQSGRTLIELMVVFAIIGGTLSVFLPFLQKVREVARRQGCADKLRQIARADLRHEQIHGNLVPARLGPDGTGSGEVRHLRYKDERSGASGFVLMLPYVEKIPRLRRRRLVRQLDVFDNDSIWPSGLVPSRVPGTQWRTPEREKAIGTRPRVFGLPFIGGPASNRNRAFSDLGPGSGYWQLCVRGRPQRYLWWFCGQRLHGQTP